MTFRENAAAWDAWSAAMTRQMMDKWAHDVAAWEGGGQRAECAAQDVAAWERVAQRAESAYAARQARDALAKRRERAARRMRDDIRVKVQRAVETRKAYVLAKRARALTVTALEDMQARFYATRMHGASNGMVGERSVHERTGYTANEMLDTIDGMRQAVYTATEATGARLAKARWAAVEALVAYRAWIAPHTRGASPFLAKWG